MDIEVEIGQYRHLRDDIVVPETIELGVFIENRTKQIFIELTVEEARMLAIDLDRHAALVEEAKEMLMRSI